MIFSHASESIMEKGCSVASSNCESAEDAQQELSELKPKKEKTPQGPQPKPSTSQVRFEAEEVELKAEGGVINNLSVTEPMSNLREDVADVDCVSSNSHEHGFAVVLDDESSTETGVLETFEISSSNSLPPLTTALDLVLRPQSVLLLFPLTIAPPQILLSMGMRMAIRRITASAPLR